MVWNSLIAEWHVCSMRSISMQSILFWGVNTGWRQEKICIVCLCQCCAFLQKMLYYDFRSLIREPDFSIQTPPWFESAMKACTGGVTCRTIEVQSKHGRHSGESFTALVCEDIYVPRAGRRYRKVMQNRGAPLMHNKTLPLLEWKATCCMSKGTPSWFLLYILMPRTLGSSLLCSGWKSIFHLSPVGQTLKKGNVLYSW